MKHLLFLLALALALPAFSQKVSESEVPEAVINGLNKTYPELKVKDWQLVEDNYEARSRIEGANAFILFSPDGKHLKTSFPLDPRELPSALLAYVDKQFGMVNFAISDLVEDADGKEYYFVELRKEGVGQGKLSELKFSHGGELLAREDFQKVEAEEPIQAEERPVRREKKEKPQEVVIVEKPEGIDESKVPAAVKTSFSRRFRMADELVWDTLGGNYIASFFQGDLNAEVHFKPGGEWVLTKEEMAPDRVYAPVARFLAEEYPGYKLDYAEKITKSDRDVNYYVEVSQRIKGMDPDPVTRIYFDKTGRVTGVEEPDLPEEVSEDIDYLHDPRFDKKLEKDLDQLESTAPANATVKESELPSGVTTYIYGKYPDIKIREAVLDQDAEWGEVYRVVISKEGLMQDSYELLFDRKGKMLADNAPADFLKKKDRTSAGQPAPEPYYEDRTKVAAASVPDIVTT
ncbi:MAG TPA: PepSY-like domain-containing protein, partial [Bacteroidales bacterium]|nr:PepSY-like domain-containing protein [Bacteroidales bacterium]